ncbi:MAG: sulfatase-like hydrolase/transferase [Gemmatimonadetes bacterium]|nr:sulfatase-like hydrolase/transferase [Gemmatimonadota bacterium]
MKDKPNLVFITSDSQRFDTLACYGNHQIQVPNLNALAETGHVFENACITMPPCAPARSTIMTGLYPHANGCDFDLAALSPEVPTIAELLPQDYHCAFCGHWSLGDELVPQHGFAEWVGIRDEWTRHASRPEYRELFSAYHQYLVTNGFQPDVQRRADAPAAPADWRNAMVFDMVTSAELEEPFTKAGFVGREASRFIRENRGRPFALYVSLLEPHTPCSGPFNDLYPPESVPVGPHFMKAPPANAALVNRLAAETYFEWRRQDDPDPRSDWIARTGGSRMTPADLRTGAFWRKFRAQYWGQITLMDRAVGGILRTLEECDLAERTIVVFTSDHGAMMGDHALLTTPYLYEENVRVPLLVRVPWLADRRRTVPGRASHVDLVPTLLELMGAPIPANLQGRSLVPVLENEATLEENDVFIQLHSPANRELWRPCTGEEMRIVSGPWRGIVSAEGWKLNLSPVDQCELYDLNTDPHEQRNLFDDPAQRDRVRTLADRIRAWQERTEDSMPLPAV